MFPIQVEQKFDFKILHNCTPYLTPKCYNTTILLLYYNILQNHFQFQSKLDKNQLDKIKKIIKAFTTIESVQKNK